MVKMWCLFLLGIIMLGVTVVDSHASKWHNVHVSHQEVLDFPKKPRTRRGFIDTLFNSDEHRRRTQEQREAIDQEVKMQEEITCRQNCWDTWRGWGQCSGQCNSGSRTRSRLVKGLEYCKDHPCPGPNIETQICHIDCGIGGIPEGALCKCYPGYLGHCCHNRVSCPQPPNPSNGDLEGMEEHPILYYDMVVTYVCDKGYALVGPEQRRCQLNGKFSGSDSICRRIECPHPNTPINGALINAKDGYYFGDTVGYKCYDGYDLKGVQTRNCVLGKDLRGAWSAFDPHCEVRHCGDPGIPTHGSKQGSEFSFDDEVIFMCERGFTMIGSENRHCLASGHWDGTQPVCKEVLCEMIESPVNGLVSSDESSVDAILEFSCETGYNLVGNEVLQCLHNGFWNGTTPICQAIDCGDPGSPTNGAREDNGFQLDSMVFFSCYGGYVLNGPKSTRCDKTGTWTNPVPACEACKINQYKEGPPDGGRCVACSPNSYTVTPASTTRQQCMCDKGYSGKPGGPCTEISCVPLTAPAHGTFGTCNSKMGDSCEMSCAEGYIISRGSSVRICTELGIWDGSDPVCEACPKDTFKADAGSCLPCPKHAHTENTGSSSSQCVCDDGYQDFASQGCIDIDECAVNNGLGDCQQACVNFQGGFRCDCTNFGYIINPDDGLTCIPEQLCKNLTEAEAPANGGLVCHWYHEENSQQCTMKCNPGYEFPTRTNQYETCGPVTGYRWSYQLVDPNALIMPCIEQLYPEFWFEADSAYFVKACRELTETDKDKVKVEFVETLKKKGVCMNRQTKICDFQNVGIICGQKRKKRGTQEEEMDVINIKLEVYANKFEEKSKNCDRICPRFRIPDERCASVCTAIYKRYLLAATKYAKIQMERLFWRNKTALAFHAANREFEVADLNVTDVVTDCSRGMKYDFQNGMCVPCLRGSMYFKEYQECVRCPAGMYQDKDLQEECLPCGPGKTSITGSTECQDCPQGTYGWDCELRCGCVHGTCDPSDGHCVCSSGWEGRHCDQDIPGCREGSCFSGVTCTDIRAPGSGYTCGACPTGYTGNGIRCTLASGK